MYPYLSDYLAIKSNATGHCQEIFNGCRTLANANTDKASGEWKFETGDDQWGGCCCWTYDREDYATEANPDPWFDPANPATWEVAGALVDPPDGNGNGFYIEPSTSPRLVTEPGFLPLEMYVTFTVIAASPRGERAYLNWLVDVLNDCCSECDGFTAEVRTECPCLPDIIEDLFDDNGCLLPLEPVDPQEPDKPLIHCDDSDPLQPFVGPPPAYSDLGRRQLLQLKFTGLEQLNDQALWFCSGNRYKISFEVNGCEWYGDEVTHCVLGADGWDPCYCVCNDIDICQSTELATVCGPDPKEQTQTLAPPKRLPNLDTVGGLIWRPGRYAQPEKQMLQACLTPPQPLSISNRLRIEIANGDKTVHNARLLVWEAVDGVPRPDTTQGWISYNRVDPVFDLPIIRMRPYEQIVRRLDCRTEVICATGEVTGSGGAVEPGKGCEGDLICGSRYWIVLAMSCDELAYGNLDLTATIKLASVQQI